MYTVFGVIKQTAEDNWIQINNFPFIQDYGALQEVLKENNYNYYIFGTKEVK